MQDSEAGVYILKKMLWSGERGWGGGMAGEEKMKIKGLETDFVMGFTKNKNEYIPLSGG